MYEIYFQVQKLLIICLLLIRKLIFNYKKNIIFKLRNFSLEVLADKKKINKKNLIVILIYFSLYSKSKTTYTQKWNLPNKNIFCDGSLCFGRSTFSDMWKLPEYSLKKKHKMVKNNKMYNFIPWVILRRYRFWQHHIDWIHIDNHQYYLFWQAYF